LSRIEAGLGNGVLEENNKGGGEGGKVGINKVSQGKARQGELAGD
jgi:hypothetical protein